MDGGFDVFISYNRVDKVHVLMIAEGLKRTGLRVWLDDWELAPGTRWQEELEKGIEQSKTVVVFVGSSGLGPWELDEFRTSLERTKKEKRLAIIPVILPDAGETPSIPPFLKAWTWVDMRTGVTDERISQLIWGITRDKQKTEARLDASAPSGQAAGPKPAAEGAFRDGSAESLRAYLQRCEVRLSTMHRIAGAFISGAGLLLILPLFLRDALTAVVRTCSGLEMSLGVVFGVVPVTTALAIPLIAMYLLIKELVLFYFSASIPGRLPKGDDEVFMPGFSLTAIPFSDDDPELKSELRALQFGTRLMNFVIPHKAREKRWLLDLEASDAGKGISLSQESRFLKDVRQDSNENIRRLRMAFGLAGAYDRTLREEAAKSELSLIRHNLLLRRLVLRYAKAFILFLWTACVMFAFLAVSTSMDAIKTRPLLTVAFVAWAALAPYFVRAPIRWIYSQFDQNADESTADPHLIRFEHSVAWLCFVASFCGALGLSHLGADYIVFGAAASVFNAVLVARAHGYLKYDIFSWI